MPKCKANENSCYNSTDYSWQDYCSYHEKCLSKLREYYSSINNIKEIATFETYFNGNCGYVVNKFSSTSEYPYKIWIVIYEPAYRSIGENLVAIEYKAPYRSLSGASSKARRIKNKLQDNDFHATPMLKIHPEAKNWKYFYNVITSPYVIKKEVGSSDSTHFVFFIHGSGTIPSDLDRHFKPLDVVKIREVSLLSGMRYYHFGVFLGNNEIVNFSRGSNGVRLTNWRNFLQDRVGELYRYHPMIPFKNPRKIVKQINWAVWKFWEDKYLLWDRNCEHFANMIVYGINFSEQVEDNKALLTAPIDITRGILAIPTFGLTLIGGPCTVNNGKGSTIKLVNEMRESNDKFGWTTSDRSERWQNQIVVPPKQSERDCRIM